MNIEYRVIATATFATAAERDAFAAIIRTQFKNWKATHEGVAKRADITRDEYYIPTQESERVI